MKRFFAVLPLLFATFVMITLPLDAEARRMGYGGNTGKQYSMPQRSAAPASAPQQQSMGSSPAAAPRSGGMSRWLGPIAGLLAGGLLASLFFGGAFDGIQLMDVLLIIGVIVVVFLVIRALRSRPAPVQMRTAEGPAFREEMPASVSSAGGAQMSVAQELSSQAPAWFNQESFIKNARPHFIRLQAAWDKGDMKDIAEYTTPEMFASLQSERLSHGNEQNYTEVVYLDTEFLGTQRDGDKVVASVRFHGGLREERDGEVQKFSEVWHVVHAWDSAEGNWFIAGISQSP